jgi:hypothetical protein
VRRKEGQRERERERERERGGGGGKRGARGEGRGFYGNAQSQAGGGHGTSAIPCFQESTSFRFRGFFFIICYCCCRGCCFFQSASPSCPSFHANIYRCCSRGVSVLLGHTDSAIGREWDGYGAEFEFEEGSGDIGEGGE